MLTSVCPKLPMRDKAITLAYYKEVLGFSPAGKADFEDYLMLRRDGIEIHFFAFAGLDPLQNYGQVYIRTNDIDTLYQWLLSRGAAIHPNATLSDKPWGQREFSLLDPDNNLLTFGQSLY